MDNRNRMFRRLSIIFLVMGLFSLVLFIILLFFMARDSAFICPENKIYCYIGSEFSYYRSAVYGLSFSMILLILLSSLFNKQIEYITEYTGYTKSISEQENQKNKENNLSSSALREYYKHMETVEQERIDKNNQLSMVQYDENDNIITDLGINDDELNNNKNTYLNVSAKPKEKKIKSNENEW